MVGNPPPVPEPKERAVKALVGVNCLVCGLDQLFEINIFRDVPRTCHPTSLRLQSLDDTPGNKIHGYMSRSCSTITLDTNSYIAAPSR